MALVSKHWPFLNPLTFGDFSLAWWAYYVRAAQVIDEASREAVRKRGRR